GAPGDTGARGAGVTTGAGGAGGTAAAGPGGARTRDTGAAGTGGVEGAGAGDPVGPGAAGAGGTNACGAGAGGAGAGGTDVGGVGARGVGVVDPGAGAVDLGAGGAGAGGAGGTGAGGTVRPRPYFVPLLQHILGVPSSTALTPPLLCPPLDHSQPPLQPASPLPAPSSFFEHTGGLKERREPASRLASPVRTGRRGPRPRPPPVPGTHAMALRSSSVPLRAPLVIIYSAYICVGCSGVAHKGYNPIRAPGPWPFVLATPPLCCSCVLLLLLLLLPAACPSSLRSACCAAMASLRVLAFDHEGIPIQFDTWLDDLQLYLLSDSKDTVLLFDLALGVATAPSATADITRYSSPATAALGRLLLSYLFPDLSALATVKDLVSHLRTSDARYRATVPADFLDRNPPLMFITLYFIVTRLLHSLRSIRDHFLSLDPTSLTVDLLEENLLAAETSAVAVGATCGTPRTPFFEGCSPSPLAPSYASAAAADVPGAEDVGAASASVKCRSSKGKGGRGGGGGSGGGGWGSSRGSGGSGGGGGGGTSGRGGGSGGGGGGSGGSGGSGGGGTGGGQRQQHQRRSETQSPQQLREWLFQRRTCGGSDSCPYAIRTGDHAGQTCWRLHTQHRCFSRLDDAWRAEFGDEVERPRWADLLRSGVAIFDLDIDVILSAMYALSVSADSDCYQCVPPDPDIAAAALGASESGASRCFFRDSTTLTPLPAPVLVRLADPSGGPVVARSSTVLPCPAVPSGSLSGLHLPAFSTNFVSTAALQDAMVTTTTPGGQVAPPCSCRLLSHKTLPWHRRLGHPSLPRLCGMHSRRLVSGLPRSLPPLPPSRAPPCLPCVEERQRAAPHSSSFPPTSAPLQTLHVWGPSRVTGQGRKRYFLLVVDDYTRSASGSIRTFLSCVFTLTEVQNGIAERRIGLVMEAPCLLPETSPTLSWTRKVGNASVFWVWGSRAFVRNPSADKLSACAIPCVFLGFLPDVPGWQFYHPTLRLVLPSQDVTFDESVPFYRPPPVDPVPPQGPAPLGVSQVDPPPRAVPGEVAVDSGAARGIASGGAEPGGADPGGAEPGGAETGDAEPGGAETGGAEPEGVEPWGDASEGAESGGGESRGVASSGGSTGASPRLSPQQLRDWLVRRARLRSGATRAGGSGAARDGGAGLTTGAGVTGGTAATGSGGGRTRGSDAGGAGAGGAGVGGIGAGGVRAGGARAVDPCGTMRPRPYFVPLLQQSQLPLELASPLPAPSPYTEQSDGLTEHCEPPSHPVLPDCIARCVPRLRPPPVPNTHAMALRPFSVPLRVPLPAPPESSLHESASASALFAELLEFAVACCLDYATALVADSASASPLSVGDIQTQRSYAETVTCPYSFEWQAAMDAEMASWKSTGTYVDEFPPPGANIVDDMWIFRVKRLPGSPPPFKARYVARGFSQREVVDYFRTFSPTRKMTTLWVLLHIAAQRDYELHSLDFSTAFLLGNLHEEIWLRRPPGFTGLFREGTQWSLRQSVYGLRQAPHEWHDTLMTTLAALGFAPSTADPSLFLRTDTSLPPFYVLVYVDDLIFAAADIEAPTLVKYELQKRDTCFELGSSALWLPVLLATAHSSVYQPLALSSTFRRVPRYVAPNRHRKVHRDAANRKLRYLCSMSGMGLMLGGRGPVVLTGHADASWVDDSATERSSSCEAEIYAGAMAAQELRWLTYLLTDLGDQPRSPPVLLPYQLSYPGDGHYGVHDSRLEGSCKADLSVTVAPRAIILAATSTPARWHGRLAHVGIDTVTSSVKHEVTTGLDIKPSAGTDAPCVSCVGGKLARHTFPNKGSDADDALAVVQIDLCGPFRVAAKDGSLYFLLLKDRKTRYVWVKPMKKSVLMLHSDQGGEFLGKEFTDFVDGKGIAHNLTCPYTPLQNDMAEREMQTVVESVRTMLLHMASTLLPGTTTYQLLTGNKPNLTLARVWGCMAQFLVPEQQRGGKLNQQRQVGLHLGVLEESKGWDFLDLTDNRVVTTSDVVFYDTMSLEVWKPEHGPASGQAQAPSLAGPVAPSLVARTAVAAHTSDPSPHPQSQQQHRLPPAHQQQLRLPPTHPPPFLATHMASTRVLQQQGQPQHSRQWGPEGPRSTGHSGGSANSGRDVGPCGYRILTGPGAGTTYWSPDHSASRCYRRLDDLHHEHFGPHAITPHRPSRLRQRTAALAESHLLGL
ncbi:unnamed protein product, partial [Closterium sp. NIES-53]